jgi:hypothetical protein
MTEDPDRTEPAADDEEVESVERGAEDDAGSMPEEVERAGEREEQAPEG